MVASQEIAVMGVCGESSLRRVGPAARWVCGESGCGKSAAASRDGPLSSPSTADLASASDRSGAIVKAFDSRGKVSDHL